MIRAPLQCCQWNSPVETGGTDQSAKDTKVTHTIPLKMNKPALTYPPQSLVSAIFLTACRSSLPVPSMGLEVGNVENKGPFL